MKKLLTAAVILLAILSISSCSGRGDSSAAEQPAVGERTASSAGGTLNIYNWTYYIPDDVVRDFEKEYGVRVVYDVFASNEEMFTKLKAGGAGYDVVFPSGDYVSIMINERMIDPIDLNKVPNMKNLDPSVLSKIRFDPGNKYSVPYMMGAAGIAVNTTKVKNYEKSWNIFNRSNLNNRMTMLDDMREVLGGALKYLGYSVNSTNPAELEKAKKVVLGWRKNIMKFDAEAFGKGFAAGEFYVVHGYQENVFTEYDPAKKSEVDFFIPGEGAAMYIDSMVILKDSKNKDLAYTFMNFIQRPDIMARIADSLTLPSINVPARSLMKETPTYQIEDLSNCEFKEDLGEALEMYNTIWQEIQIGS